ncbi:hypothetical protein [Pseudoalteromonas gelatinilytica]|uniref:Uncharacterized protein n=1 Tax=Pseudoalteromonas gelatinilytica TaxID=1703256 RepID=A0A3A3EWV2_9GAMM|nr:hypothetical protein [Pseudoalteromonas profundi]RJF32542.1 hypothetical protein D4741_19165 [Pseudoalteromonas profundi]
MKKHKKIIGGLAAISIPVSAIDNDGNGLYGSPDSIREKISTHEVNKKINLSLKGDLELNNLEKKISTHIERMLKDIDYANNFQFIRDDFYNELGIDPNDLDENVKLIELWSSHDFRVALKEKDYDFLILKLMDNNLIDKDDFAALKTSFEESLFAMQSGCSEEDMNKVYALLQNDKPDFISFVILLVNVAVGTNLVAGVVAALAVAVATAVEVTVRGGPDPINVDTSSNVITNIYLDIGATSNVGGGASAGVGGGHFIYLDIHGFDPHNKFEPSKLSSIAVAISGSNIAAITSGQEPFEKNETKELKVNYSKLGQLASNYPKTQQNIKLAFKVGEVSNDSELNNIVFRELAKKEMYAFYSAAYNLGLIESEERLESILEKIKCDINKISIY